MIRLAATLAATISASSSLFALCLAGGCVVRTPSLLARASVPLPSGPPAGLPSSPPSDPPAAQEDNSQVIEAGCSFRANDIHRAEPGMVRQVVCPAGCDKDIPVFGTDSYTSDTPICAAAMHAGAISARGGAATVVLEPGRPAYRGSKRNGIESRDWGTYRASYRFEGVRRAPVAEVAPAPVVIEAGCSFSANDIHGEPGSVHRVSCPAGCSKEGAIWGSDPYTSASPICLAAIHAGLASEGGGGEVTVILDDGKPAYRGSKRNGVESHDWGAHRASYRFRH